MFDFRNMELQMRYGRSPTEMLLQTWAVDNVNAATLRDALVEAELIRAANSVQRLLGGEQVPVIHIAICVTYCHSCNIFPLI